MNRGSKSICLIKTNTFVLHSTVPLNSFGLHPPAKFFEKSDRFIILSFKQMSSFKIIFVVIGILKISTGVLVKMLYLDLLHTCFWRSHVDQNIIDIIKMIDCSTMIPS